MSVADSLTDTHTLIDVLRTGGGTAAFAEAVVDGVQLADTEGLGDAVAETVSWVSVADSLTDTQTLIDVLRTGGGAAAFAEAVVDGVQLAESEGLPLTVLYEYDTEALTVTVRSDRLRDRVRCE